MISIGLPAVKTQFLAEAIRSVLHQTHTGFELIVCNDRVDQGVRAVAGEFDDPRIRYVEGTGPLQVVDNWNHVLSLADGDFFVLFSDDDRYHPGFLEEMMRLAGAFPDCNLFRSRVNRIGPSGKLLGTTALCRVHETGAEFILSRVKGQREQFAPEFMSRTKVLRTAGGFARLPLAWGSDDLTWFRVALRGGVACSDRALTDWRESPLQISRSGDANLRLEAVDLYISMLRELIDDRMQRHVSGREMLDEACTLLDAYAARQKEHLVVVNALNASFPAHLRFFLRNRKRHRLTVRGLLYSLHRKVMMVSSA